MLHFVRLLKKRVSLNPEREESLSHLLFKNKTKTNYSYDNTK